jgi:sec-independent protein translocase protein TatA
MGYMSIWHWLVVLVIVVLLFGRGRIADIMADLGKGLKSFKKSMSEEDSPASPRLPETPAAPAQPAPAAQPAPTAQPAPGERGQA